MSRLNSDGFCLFLVLLMHRFPFFARGLGRRTEITGRASGTRESVEITFLVIHPGLVRSGTIVEETAAVRFPMTGWSESARWGEAAPF